MAHHESVTCPRCKAAFECRVGTILQCQCQQVTLTDDERVFINATYAACLCANCLTTMKELYNNKYGIRKTD
jgi:hypothetical protein